MKMKLFSIIIFFIFFNTQQISANEASNWLKKEIDIILNSYKNTNMSKETRFLIVEDTINYNFAGAGIAKFVAGDSWVLANKENKKKYIKLFKRHLALNISSMMEGYSHQKYQLKNTDFDSHSKVSLIEMEIYHDNGSLTVTWRVKKSKERYYIIDLLVANISLVITKRSEFNSMLKNINNSLEELNILLEQQNKISYDKIIN